MNAGDVLTMLRRHYMPEGKPPAGVLAHEVTSPDGRRRADALWIPVWRSAGSGIVGHEIKVSRSDLLTELADLSKADPWMRYCNRWWLTVSDPKIVDGLDIPETWGIMAPPSGRRTRSMTILRPAPTLEPLDAGPAWNELFKWQRHRHDAEIIEHHTAMQGLRYEVQHTKRNLEIAREQATTAALNDLTGGNVDRYRAQRAVNIIKLIDAGIGQSLRDDTSDEEIAAAIVDLAVTRDAVQILKRDMMKRLASFNQFRAALNPWSAEAEALLAELEEAS